MLVCSWVIMKRVWINNVCSVLTDATHYHAQALILLLQDYLAINMEVFLEGRMLEDLAPDLIKQLSAFVRAEQAKKYPLSRSTRIVDKAMETWGDWLALQDIPQPIVPSFRPRAFKDSPKLSPPGPTKRGNRQSNVSVPNSPLLRPTFSSRPAATGIPDDEVFMMDEPEAPVAGTAAAPVAAPGMPARVPSGSESPARPVSGWKTITSAPKVDMKSIIAEASTSKAGPSKPIGSATRGPEPPHGTPPRPPMEAPTGGGPIPRIPSGSSWRIPPPAGTPPYANPVALPSPGKDARHRPSAPSSTSSPSAATAAPSTAPRSQPTTPRKPAAPGLGPVITPTKQASSSSSSIQRVQ